MLEVVGEVPPEDYEDMATVLLQRATAACSIVRMQVWLLVCAAPVPRISSCAAAAVIDAVAIVAAAVAVVCFRCSCCCCCCCCRRHIVLQVVVVSRCYLSLWFSYDGVLLA